MEHQGGFGGNPSGHFTPSFPTPATLGAQASHQAPFQAHGSEPFISGAGMPWPGHPNANALAPPPAAVAPQTFQPESHPYWAMPPAGALNASSFQQFGGAAPRSVRGEELAARVAAININILSSQQPFHPNYTHGGWPQQQQAPPAGANSYGGATGWAPPMPHPAGWPTNWAPPAHQPGGQMSWAPPALQPGGQMSWAPPVQHQPGGHAMSWAAPAQQPGGDEAMSWAPAEQRRRVPAAPPASGSAQTHPPAVMMGGKSLEEFLMEAGIIDERPVDDMVIENLIRDLMGEGTAESGPVQPGGRPVVSLGVGGYGQPPPSAAGSFSSVVWSGQRSDQVGLRMVRAQEEEQEEEDDDDDEEEGCDPDAVAARARARRSRRMAKRKEAIAKARPAN